MALIVSCLLLPSVAMPIPAIPGFVPVNQTALVLVYGITTYLLFSQFVQTRTVPVLVLAAGSLYTTGIVFVQLLCFPNVFAPGLPVGTGPATLTWLWTFWHLGPPLFALPYAIMEGDGRRRILSRRAAAWAGWLAAGASLAAVLGIAFVTIHLVAFLPKIVGAGDDYWPLTTSGIGPAVQMLTVLTLLILCWTSRLRSVLQLWMAVSLFLLVLDNLVTDLGAARGTVGWMAGRIGALLAGLVLLLVYLAELDFLRRRAETIAVDRETARVQAQTARDNLALALEATGLGDWELDLRTDTATRTLRHDQIFGHDRLLPRWGRAVFLEHVLPADRPLAAAAFADAMRTGRLELECRITRADDGTVRWVYVLGRTQHDSGGIPVSMAGCVMDVTERRQTDERLRQAERLKAIGQLTGGVAHDFNNLLTVIIGSLEMLKRPQIDEARATRLVTNALVAARRGAGLTSQLLSYSRQQVLRSEVVAVNGLLQAFEPMLAAALKPGVALRLDLDPAVDRARFDPRQLEATLLNLVSNACDAMPSGGRITLATRPVVLDAAMAAANDVVAGPYLRLSVTDTGFGMDAATARVAFDPFFTTKDVGKGTGLGLSQVYGFAKQAGGGARIDSVVGVGTTVQLLLPELASGADPAPPLRRESVPLRRATQGEVVLVVEDDPAVLELAVENLHELGYKTLTADTGRTALERLRGSERIDVLFSDVVMPGGMSGVQLATLSRTIRDGLKVVLTSGYTAATLADDHAVPAGMPLLSKPYAREDLAQTLHRILRPS